MEQWITSIMSDYGYLGIFLLIMLENVFPPIPSEVILTVGGFMTTTTDMTILGVILACRVHTNRAPTACSVRQNLRLRSYSTSLQGQW